MAHACGSAGPVGFLAVAALLACLDPAAGAAVRAQSLGARSTPAHPPSPEALPRASPPPADWVEWLRQGRFWASARLRYEDVDQVGFAKRANALTLRTALGIETAHWRGWSGTLEFEDVAPLFHDDYNSTTNGNAQYPVVLDPRGAEVNQAFLEYSEAKRWDARIGRQRLAFDNQRFVGNVAWRQNEQTFDAVKLAALDVLGVEAVYVYVDNVERVNGDASPIGELPSHTHLVHLSRAVGPAGSLAAYAYLLDSPGDPTKSSDTFGARLTGKRAIEHDFGALWTAEFALQQDAGDNPNDVDQPYYLAELGGSWRGVTLLAGRETLGGSGDPGDAFQTPLATLHNFNGWADKFLTTPDTGLVDLYVGATQSLAPVDLQLVWHRFEADSGGDDYGTELDASLVWKVTAGVQLGLKLADYDADDFATDTTRLWCWLAYSP